jgi:hypothetical protein
MQKLNKIHHLQQLEFRCVRSTNNETRLNGTVSTSATLCTYRKKKLENIKRIYGPLFFGVVSASFECFRSLLGIKSLTHKLVNRGT